MTHFDLSFFLLFSFFFFFLCICYLLISFLSVILGKYHSSSGPKTENENHFSLQSEEETTGQILQHEKSAAGVFCKLKTRHGSQASHLQSTKDVLGIVASLGIVEDENLSRLIYRVFFFFFFFSHLSLVI